MSLNLIGARTKLRLVWCACFFNAVGFFMCLNLHPNCGLTKKDKNEPTATMSDKNIYCNGRLNIPVN